MRYLEAMILLANGTKVTNVEFKQPFYWQLKKRKVVNPNGRILPWDIIFQLGNRFKEGWEVYYD